MHQLSVAMVLCCLAVMQLWPLNHQKENDLGWSLCGASCSLQSANLIIHTSWDYGWKIQSHATMTNFWYSWPLTSSYSVVPDVMVAVSFHNFQFAQRWESLTLSPSHTGKSQVKRAKGEGWSVCSHTFPTFSFDHLQYVSELEVAKWAMCMTPVFV